MFKGDNNDPASSASVRITYSMLEAMMTATMARRGFFKGLLDVRKSGGY